MTSEMMTLTIDAWREEGEPENPAALLVGNGRIAGTLVLAEAIQVVENEAGEQRAADPRYEERLDRYWDAFSMDGSAETVAIAGREYLVFIAPGC